MDSCVDNETVSSDEVTVDPELELVRQVGLAKEQVDYHQLAETLASKVHHIHSAYLFEQEGREALRILCKLISSTPTSISLKCWKDLAGVLGLDCSDIGCIQNYKNDYTEMVLMTFAQSPDASLSHIVRALDSIKRYDALAVAIEQFPALCQRIEAQYGQRVHQLNDIPTNDLSSNVNENDAVIKKLLTPFSQSELRYQLPVTLRDNLNQVDIVSLKTRHNDVVMKHEHCDIEDRISRLQLITSAPLSSQRRPHNHKQQVRLSKKVMLTFASDGMDIVKLVLTEFTKRRDSLDPIGVLILENYAEKVLQNPERFITHQFARMDYIIPIVTEGYLEILCNMPNLYDLSTLDSKYIQLIHDHMSKYYTENFCRNDKMRCIVPKGSREVFNHPHFKKDPVFKVYTFDDPEEVEKLAIRLAKAQKKKK